MTSLKLRHVKGFACQLPGSVAASPSENGILYYAAGSIIVSSSEDDPRSQQFLRGHAEDITSLTVSRNGALIASGSRGKAPDAVVWDTASNTELFRLCEHDYQVNALAFSSDQRLLCSVGSNKDEKVYTWDMKTGNIVTKGFIPRAMNNDPNSVSCIAWAPPIQGGYMLATAGDPDIHLWTIDPFRGDMQAEKVIPGTILRQYTCVIFSRDGQWLFAGSKSGDVVCINVKRKAVQTVHPVCSLGVGALIDYGDDLLVAGGDGTLTLLRPLEMRSSEKPCAVLPGGITSLSRTADGQALIAGTSQGRVVRVEQRDMHVSIISATHEAAVRGAAFRGDHLATCCNDTSIRVWDINTLELVTQITNPTRRGDVMPHCVFITEEGEVLSGWSNGQLFCHDLSGNCLWLLHSAHISPSGTGVTSVNVSFSGKFIATGGQNGDVRVWDRSSRELVSSLTQHKDLICDLKVYNDDVHIISGSKDGTFIIWDVYRESRVSSHVCPTGGFTALELAADQVQVVTVGLDRKLQFWDVRHQTPLQVIDKAHADVCTSMGISNACDLVASGGADWAVKLWDFKSGACISEGHVHSGTVNRLVFSEDDSTIVSVGEDGFIVFWDVVRE